MNPRTADGCRMLGRRSRRWALLAGLAGADALAGCALARPTEPGGGTAVAGGPREIVWSKTQIGQPQDGYWIDTWRAAEEATGVKITPAVEPGQDYWTKRQAEFASGTTAVDLMSNNLGWVLPGGLNGMFVDLSGRLRRDKIDTKIFYRADIDSWSWKGQLWSIPSQSGGEVVFVNKKLFAARGVPLPNRSWTYDDLLDICRKLNDPASNAFAIEVGQNGLHYIMGTFALNFGGKILDETRSKALYGDDVNAIRGVEYDVDLHRRHYLTPTAEARSALGSGQRPLEAEMVAMEMNGLFRRATAQPALGAENLDFVPPPRGPKGIQRASVAGNAWAMLKLSAAQDAAWRVLKWLYTTKEGQATPQLKAVAWPPLIATANSPAWLDQFHGTQIADCAAVWESGGHDILPLPEGQEGYSTMNGPLTRALAGEIGTREAMQESARALNELFSRRPAAWK